MAKTKTKKAKTSESGSNEKFLVIVESPAKAKTIKKILGNSYEIKASFGHIRDFPKKFWALMLKRNLSLYSRLFLRKKKLLMI